MSDSDDAVICRHEALQSEVLRRANAIAFPQRLSKLEPVAFFCRSLRCAIISGRQVADSSKYTIQVTSYVKAKVRGFAS